MWGQVSLQTLRSWNTIKDRGWWETLISQNPLHTLPSWKGFFCGVRRMANANSHGSLFSKELLCKPHSWSWRPKTGEPILALIQILFTAPEGWPGHSVYPYTGLVVLVSQGTSEHLRDAPQILDVSFLKASSIVATYTSDHMEVTSKHSVPLGNLFTHWWQASGASYSFSKRDLKSQYQ